MAHHARGRRRPRRQPDPPLRHRGAEAALAARPVRGPRARRLRAHRARRRQRRRRDPHARRADDGDEWVIDGAKAFITNSGTPITVARHGHRAHRTAARSPRSSCPPGTPGLEVEPPYRKMGWHASDTHGADVRRVPGARPTTCSASAGSGFATSSPILDDGRIAISALAVGLRAGVPRAGVALREASATRSAADRRATRASRSSCADLAVAVENARNLTYKAAWLQGHGPAVQAGGGDGQALLDRGRGRRATRDATQIFGGYGLHRRDAGQPLLPRRQDPRDRRGHERDPAARHRPRARAPRPVTTSATRPRDDPPCSWKECAGASRPRWRACCHSWRRVTTPRAPPSPRSLPTAVARTPSASPARRAPASPRSPTRSSRRPRATATRSAVLAVDPSTPVHRRRHPRRPGAHAGARHRRRRVHPLDGHPRPPRRARAAPRRRRCACSTPPAAVGPRRDRRRRPGRGRDRRRADTTVVVVNPGWGDGVQANKAGLLEIADVFVVNKADRAGADATVSDLVAMLDSGRTDRWTPPIVHTVATTGGGIDALWDAVLAHRDHLVETGLLERRRRERLHNEIREMVKARVVRMAEESCRGPAVRRDRGARDAWRLRPAAGRRAGGGRDVRRGGSMSPDHGFHPLRVQRIVQETHDTKSFVFDVPADARDAFLRGRAVLHVPGSDRRRRPRSAATRCRARPTPTPSSPPP